MKVAIVLFALIAALSFGCASSKVVQPSSGPCVRVDELTGTWKNYRLSSLGPAWMTITFNCDCRARVVAQTLFMRYTEEVPYRVEDGVIVFTRTNSETRWPYSFASEALIISETENERHGYHRSKQSPPCRPAPETRQPN